MLCAKKIRRSEKQATVSPVVKKGKTKQSIAISLPSPERAKNTKTFGVLNTTIKPNKRKLREKKRNEICEEKKNSTRGPQSKAAPNIPHTQQD